MSTIEGIEPWYDSDERTELMKLQKEIMKADSNPEKNEIKEKTLENKKKITPDQLILKAAKQIGISDDDAYEYINLLKDSGENSENLSENFKTRLGLENIDSSLNGLMGFFYFCIKKYCPNTYDKVIPLLSNMLPSEQHIDGALVTFVQDGSLQLLMKYIKSWGDSAYEYMYFCSPFEGSYIKEGISHMHGKNFGETLNQMKERYDEKESKRTGLDFESFINTTQEAAGNESMIAQFFENFIMEPEGINLLSFIKENPQKLDNLGGKEIKSIDLSFDSGINFAFRGIIEMVKSRDDIDFPHLVKNPLELDKKQRENERKKIIKEYEDNLRNFIAKDREENSEIDKKPFDKVFFTLSKGTLGFSEQKDSDVMPSKDWAQQFSGSEVLDYSDDNRRIGMITDLENYVHEHPDEKILVCINQHGSEDGASSNGWTKEDRHRLANISPNIKIWSIRCFFGKAYDNSEIYDLKSAVSGFSNTTPTQGYVTEIINESMNKKLGFHEMEIYTRLNYPVSITPLTEDTEYTNRKTGETEIGKIGIAQNVKNENNGPDKYYA